MPAEEKRHFHSAGAARQGNGSPITVTVYGHTLTHNIREESYYNFRFPAGLVRIIPGGDCSRIPVKGNTKVEAGLLAARVYGSAA